MKYVSLHTHSTFSYGDGYGTVAEHVSRAVELEMTALALTEHGNVSSWVQLEKACRAAEIKPIFGIEIYFAPPGVVRKNHMTLLAMDSVGLQNINTIVTESWKTLGTTSKSKFPTVHWNVLRENNAGIIALSGCSDSQLSCTLLGGKSFGDKRLQLRDGDFEKAIGRIVKYQKVFGDRFFLEVQRFPGLERTCVLNPEFAELSRCTGALLVATSDVHYPYGTDNAMQRILHAAHRGGSVESADATWEYDILLTYPESDEEILADLEATGLSKGEALAAIMNSAIIAENCTASLPKAPPPTFGVDNPKAVLRQWISAGWHRRKEENEFLKTNAKEYKARVLHEYETICAREGFADYFLMVADIVQWAKFTAKIAVGPGRGSSVGSLVCYLLSITEIDSMQFPVLFERFLDPTRTDPPDIDIDFDDKRRDEVFAYAATKYSEKMVANIGTVTRYKGPNSLDDIARVYHIAGWKIQSIKDKLLERAEGHPRFAKSIEDTLNSFVECETLAANDPEIRYAARLEGNIRNFGVHAAGMVISSVPINDLCATYEKRIGERQGRAIAFDKYDAAYLGMLKIDFLSLNTLGMIAKVCDMAGISLDTLYRLDLNHPEVLRAFASGDVLGIFQFEGITTRRILKQVKPTKFMHLSDVNALSRPGAQDREYIAHKNAGTWESSNPIVQQHLSWTYGVIVYEEQILMLLRDLGGFAPQQVNRIRKIIHDKLGSTEFDKYRELFVKGCAAQGFSEETARKMWEAMTKASGYAFNIAHSVAYSHIAYWSMWLKMRYPAAFFTGCLLYVEEMSDPKERDARRIKMIQAAQLHDIDVLPPKINVSQENWWFFSKKNLGMFDRPTIVAGLNAIPGLGPKRIEGILAERKRSKLFGDMEFRDLLEIPGLGPKTVATIEKFCEDDDPFKVGAAQRVLREVRAAVKSGDLADVPVPTHVSVDIPKTKELVVFTGIIRSRKYYNAIEQLMKRKTDLTKGQAAAQLKDPHLLKYVALYCDDEFGETVRVSINRWRYPQYQYVVEHAKIGSDVIVVEGFSSDFQGISIEAKHLVILEWKDE